MLNLISIAIGLVAFSIGLVGLLPLFGWLNWAAIPIAAVGLLVGLFSDGTTGRNLNIVVMVLGFVRLSIGGGVL